MHDAVSKTVEISAIVLFDDVYVLKIQEFLASL